MPKPIGEQVVVITGASSGIGLAAAKRAARRGARVVLAARNARSLDDAVAMIRGEGGEAVAVPTDVADRDQVEALADAAVTTYGRIDTWVNNAGVLNTAGFLEQPIEDFEQVMRINFLGQVYGARAALPRLEQTGGALVCVGSAYGDRGSPYWTAYCASKHAVKGWLDGLRIELQDRGSPVRVTLIKPATINTPLFRKTKSQLGVKPTGVPPRYSPELVAEAVIRAAEGDERDIYVGDTAVLLSIGERLSPKLVDRFMRYVAIPLQETDEPRGEEAPNNLYAPVADDGGEHGEFPELPWSLYQAAHRPPPGRHRDRPSRGWHPRLRPLAKGLMAAEAARPAHRVPIERPRFSFHLRAVYIPRRRGVGFHTRVPPQRHRIVKRG